MKNDHPAGPLDFDVSRREMLKQAGLVSVGLAVTPVPGWPASWFKQEVTVVPFTDMANYRGASRMAQDLRELTSWLTPTEDFFSIGHYGTPEVDASAYRLQVTGLVERPITLTLDELKARPKVEPTTVFECSGNSRGLVHGMVGNATWAGAALIPLLAEVRPTADSREVYFWGADTGTEEIRGQEYEQNFARSMSLEHVNELGPILAYEMNGEPLPAAHGFPVRLIVPGWYGIAQVKWLERIELGVDRLMTRFMAKDYVTLMGREENGRTEWLETSVTHQRVKSVIARVTRAEDQFTIFGAAWSDGTPLDRVEVRVDDGAWRAATMDRPDDPHTWTFFTFETEGLTPGEHTLVSRATDVDGRTQPVDLSMKLTRWENNELFERTIQVS
ncbi:MAG: molybdopterin-dependent oxidoreductase [Gemmatimonadota bacterium]|nr:molybdopterin-dependent oxidoreductase [Gemmatimonadota bacterium]MED5564813.1 molybdopterin-dependent oxidoreductase [Gemmatimonadota bacterium]